MRIYPKRTLGWLLLIGITQLLMVYYWLWSPGTRGKVTLRPRLLKIPRTSPAAGGTCDVQLCGGAKEGALNVHIVAHSHDDVGWLKTPDQYYTGSEPNPSTLINGQESQCVRCVLTSTISELARNPNRKFIFIEMAFFQRFWQELNATTRDLVRGLIERRQLELVLGGWVMSDAAVTYYNDIIDQHTLGFDFIQDTFGPCAQSRVAWHVDQFGHSREHAAIFAKMGFDGLFIGRVDFQDHEIRKNSKRLEFLWETSPNMKEHAANLFTQMTYDGYFAPSGYVMDNADEFFSGPTKAAAVDEFISVVRTRAKAFRSSHLLLPMGSDFGYRNARQWFHNIDVLISLVQQKQGDQQVPVNLFYSTPSCYLQAVHASRLTWEVKADDLHPYAVPRAAYWTGYFTSRGGQKLMVKHAGALLQTCKQLGIFAGLTEALRKTDVLRKAMAVMQHHDAITGTEKQHVANEYNRMLSEGMTNCQSVVTEAYNKLLTTKPDDDFKFFFCPNLNNSECYATENFAKLVVVTYNPMSRPVPTWIRLPVKSPGVQVRDSHGQLLHSQLVPIPEAVQRVPERRSDSDTEVVFQATLPAMGYTSFVLETSPQAQGSQKSVRDNLDKRDVVIQNQHLSATFDGETGRLRELVNLPSGLKVKLSQDFAHYWGVQGGEGRSSGAYVFIPEKGMPIRVGGSDPVHIRVFRGDQVQEVHQRFSPWVSQVVRLYNGSRHLELQWTVGPIPVKDQRGKEVVSFFVSDLKTDRTFYTDSNGREVLQRRLNHRDTWNLTVVDPVSGNYYPVTSRIYIQDQAKNIQLTVLPDRCQGGSSLHEGTLEMMVHRRLLFDDGLGVGEPLDERGIDKNGVVYTGKHLLFLDTIANSVVLTREAALNVHFAPTFTFAPLTSSSTGLPPSPSPSGYAAWPERSFLNSGLPPNLQILTLDYTHGSQESVYLLRLEHIYESNENIILSAPTTVQLKDLFAPFEIVEVEEVSLGGNLSPDSYQRLSWTNSRNESSTPSIGSPDYKEDMVAPFTIKLFPMEIRTFRVSLVPRDPSLLFKILS